MPKDDAVKSALRQARIHLLDAQAIIGPLVFQYQEIDELIESLEEMIMKK